MELDEAYGAAVLSAWQGTLEFSDLVATASRLEAARLGPLAAVLYQTWLRRNVSAYAHAAWFNLGATLFNEADYPGAESAYREALALAPGFVQPRHNLGILYERIGRLDDAIAEWRWIEENVGRELPENRSLVLMAVNHLGRVEEARKRFRDAERWLSRSLAIEPVQPDVIHHWVHLRQKQCAWPVYPYVPGVSPALMEESTSALAMISVTDDPAVQLRAARRYVERKVISDVPRLAASGSYGHRRLRLAYCSSDFCMHPISLLTAEMFELHDRERFEIHGYCWSPEDGSATRQRVIAAMDHFRRIDRLSDAEAAKLIRDDEIDILIDLQGQTSGARANMLAYRPAPIQITYLGLPATTGLPSIDYVIADRFLIPEELAPWYSEKPLYMPDVYQVSDRRRRVSAMARRSEHGLPEDAFVFCSFNNNYKFTPEMFEVWMNILQRAPGSVLWLLSDNEWAQASLVAHAKRRGIDAARLIFAGRVAPEDYLARYALADLFLDTFPFNAGTTANDALWMGLPILTRCGRAFASRMAGALLTAARLPELIVDNLADYEEKAVALANHPQDCRRLHEHLAAEREHGTLFDTPRFVRNLESRLLDLAGGR